METLKESLVSAFRTIEKRYEEQGDGLNTGVAALNLACGCGLRAGTAIAVVSRHGAGLRSLACDVAKGFAQLRGGVIWFSRTLSAEEIALRLLVQKTKVLPYAIAIGHLVENDFVRLAATAGELQHLKIGVVDISRGEQGEDQVRLAVTQAESPVSLVINEGAAPWAQRVARDLSVVVLALQRAGGIQDPSEVDLIIELERRGCNGSFTTTYNRNGPTGAVPLVFCEDYLTFIPPRQPQKPKAVRKLRKKKLLENSDQILLGLEDVTAPVKRRSRRKG